MTPEGFKTVFLGGAQDRAQRTAIIQQFKTGEAKVLITTNVQAIGVDMQAVSIVINYDIPTLGGNMKMGDAAAYLQRIGGRPPGGRGAVSISLVHNEAGMVALTSITGQHGVSLQQMDSNDWAETANTIEKSWTPVKLQLALSLQLQSPLLALFLLQLTLTVQDRPRRRWRTNFRRSKWSTMSLRSRLVTASRRRVPSPPSTCLFEAVLLQVLRNQLYLPPLLRPFCGYADIVGRD
jgi:hypothetical protein